MKVSKRLGLSRRSRGASLVEYALLLVGVVLMAAVAVKALGPKIGQAATNTEGML